MKPDYLRQLFLHERKLGTEPRKAVEGVVSTLQKAKRDVGLSTEEYNMLRSRVLVNPSIAPFAKWEGEGTIKNPWVTGKFRINRKPGSENYMPGEWDVARISLQEEMAKKLLTEEGYKKLQAGKVLVPDEDFSFTALAAAAAKMELERRRGVQNPSERMGVAVLGVLGILGLLALNRRG